MSGSILPLLVCPLTKQHLHILHGKKAEEVKAVLARGDLRYVDGTGMNIKADRVKFLITENGRYLYAVIDDIPALLESKQIDIQL